MKRILFLDDNPARLGWARRELGPGNALYLVPGVREATLSLFVTTREGGGIEADKPFDVVYLDHDLGEETNVDSSRRDCGMEVVRWIVANRPAIGKVIVHTLNAPAANAMVAALRGAGYDAEYVNFLRLVRENEERPTP